MTSPDNTIAAAVVALLSGTPAFSGVTVHLRHVPLYDVETLDRLHIAVAPRIHGRRLASRASTERLYTIQIAPHIRVRSDADGAPDPEQLADFVDTLDLIADTIEQAARTRYHFGGATLTTLDADPLIDADLIQSPGVLRGILSATFKIVTQPATPTP